MRGPPVLLFQNFVISTFARVEKIVFTSDSLTSLSSCWDQALYIFGKVFEIDVSSLNARKIQEDFYYPLFLKKIGKIVFEIQLETAKFC